MSDPSTQNSNSIITNIIYYVRRWILPISILGNIIITYLLFKIFLSVSTYLPILQGIYSLDSQNSYSLQSVVNQLNTIITTPETTSTGSK